MIKLDQTYRLLLLKKKKAKIELNLDGSGKAENTKFNVQFFDLDSATVEEIVEIQERSRDGVIGNMAAP